MGYHTELGLCDKRGVYVTRSGHLTRMSHAHRSYAQDQCDPCVWDTLYDDLQQSRRICRALTQMIGLSACASSHKSITEPGEASGSQHTCMAHSMYASITGRHVVHMRVENGRQALLLGHLETPGH